LNEDLVQAVALAHDLGHSPFGHSGEEALDRLLKDHGGFDHNDQSLRVVTLLESPYEGIDGLNLSFEVLEGIQKHATARHITGLGSYPCACLEGQIADLADEIAYYAHDLQDGLEAGLINPAQLSDITLCADVARKNNLKLGKSDAKRARLSLARLIANHLIQDVLETSSDRITASSVQSADEVRRHRELLIGYSEKTAQKTIELRSFLYANLYYHPDVAEANRRACDMLAAVFNTYLIQPQELGREAARRVASDGLHRAVADYIAGMTDRYLLREHARLFGDR
jgi:dGTPase